HLSQLGGHVGAVGLQEGKPLLLVPGPGGYELGVAPDGLDGHAGGAQLGADGNPLQVFVLVAPPAAVGSGDVVNNPTCTLVVPRGSPAAAGAAGGLGDAQACLGPGARGPGNRLDFEHALNPSVVSIYRKARTAAHRQCPRIGPACPN